MCMCVCVSKCVCECVCVSVCVSVYVYVCVCVPGDTDAAAWINLLIRCPEACTLHLLLCIWLCNSVRCLQMLLLFDQTLRELHLRLCSACTCSLPALLHLCFNPTCASTWWFLICGLSHRCCCCCYSTKPALLLLLHLCLYLVVPV